MLQNVLKWAKTDKDEKVLWILAYYVVQQQIVKFSISI